MDNNLPEFSTDAVRQSVGRLTELYTSESLARSATPIHLDDSVLDLFTDLEKTGFIAPFDWHAWADELGPGWNNDRELLESADLDTLRRLLIAHQRLERVHRHHLDTLFRSGYMEALFRRLQEVLE